VAGPTFPSGLNQNVITIDPHNPSNIYVGAADGVWFSHDWGQTLALLNWPVTRVSNVAIDPQDPTAIYVCTFAGLYQSLNGGATWRKLTLPSSSAPYTVTVSPADPNILLVGLSLPPSAAQARVLPSTDP